jgi:hydroxypyruvate isomerase
VPTPVAANVSILFTERPFLERFGAAAKAGFAAVEFWWPHGEHPPDLIAAVRDAGVDVVLINFDGGDLAAGDRGLANDPDREERFHDNIPIAIDLARRMKCRQMNALVGIELPDIPRGEQLARAAANIRRAARAAAPHGIRVLIEALNTFDNGPCLISRTHQAVDFIAQIGEPNVAVQYDVFHMQRMEGNLVETIRANIGQIAHVQIADVPGRGEPGTGEIDFAEVFGTLAELGYVGHISAEYRPTTKATEASLGWLASAREALLVR